MAIFKSERSIDAAGVTADPPRRVVGDSAGPRVAEGVGVPAVLVGGNDEAGCCANFGTEVGGWAGASTSMLSS